MSGSPGVSGHEERIRAAKVRLRASAQIERRKAWQAWTARSRDAAGMALAQSTSLVLTAARRSHPPRIASAYLPMRTEIDPLPLLGAIFSAGVSTALPVVPGKGVALHFRRWHPGDATVEAGFGTREPSPASPLVDPDLLLVPLLAFDAEGYRLGYGGGYYDRTLARLRASPNAVTAIGIAFAEQEVDDVPHLDYDQRLDGVLTPSGLRLFAG